MPYSGPGDEKLPEKVKALPEKVKAQWVEVWNSAYGKCTKDGGNTKDCESSAFAQAWGVVNKHRSKIEFFIDGIKEWWEQFSNPDGPDGNIVQDSIKKVSAWDGSASKYGGAKQYCDACLINVNDGPSDKWVQDKCMLPIREPGDGSGTYVDKAVHAAAGGHGITQVQKPDGVDAGKWDSAVRAAANKIISAYSAMGEVAPAAVYKLAGKTAPKRSMPVVNVFDAVVGQIAAKDPLAFITDIFTDDNGGLFAVIAANGKLYRANIDIANDNITVSPDWAEIKVDVNAPAVRSSGTIARQKDGRYRLLSISCSSVLNRVGQVDSKALFDSFIVHAEQTGEYPIRQFYHAGTAFRTGQVDWMGRDDNLLLMSTLYDDTDIAKREIAARLKDPTYWGDSIGFDPVNGELVDVGNGIAIPVYTQGICKEVSTLPENQAAAWYTAAPTVKEVVRMLNQNQFAAFVKFFEGEPDPEAAAKAWLEQNSATRNRAIEETGAITRAADTPNATTDVVVAAVSDVAAPVTDVVVTTMPEPAQDAVTVTNAAPVDPNVKPPDTTPTPQDTPKPAGMDDAMLSKIVDAVMAKLTPLLQDLGVEMSKQTAQVALTTQELASKVKALQATDEEKKRAYLQDLPHVVAPPEVPVTFRPREVRNDGEEKENFNDIAAETVARCPVKY